MALIARIVRVAVAALPVAESLGPSVVPLGMGA